MRSDRALCAKVRESCQRVVDRARLVRLDDHGLDRLSSIAADELKPGHPPAVNFAEDATLLSLASNAINFGSGYHDLLRKDRGSSGARTINARLRSYVGATGPLTPGRLGRITAADCSQIFGQELDGGAVEELMSYFATALNDLGSFVVDAGGTARSVLDRCDNSAVALAEHLLDMPFYRDVEQHDGEAVAFYKRAQITPADLARAGLWHFGDLSELTAFADNLVPHVLRLDGAIQVDPALVSSIESGVRLEPGSTPEVELRAAAVVAVEGIVGRIDRSDIWPMHVDQWLWERGAEARYKSVRRPRARTVFY
ncbi:MAG: hypothetical protein HKN24_12685 [Acidimicrobiales bacterium]|nr:hypothetical protein [Acidimicrobiales bacterium]